MSPAHFGVYPSYLSTRSESHRHDGTVGTGPRLVKRGRPLKFGRAAELVALTLPHDVLEWLRGINVDPARAIVSLFDSSAKRRRPRDVARPEMELVSVGRRQSLIVVDEKSVTTLPGVSLISLGAGRSFLALESGKGMADLEVAVLDRLEARNLAESERRILAQLRWQLREWRQDSRLSFQIRSIILVEPRRPRRPHLVKRPVVE